MNDYLNFAVSVAREAGDLLLFFHGKGMSEKIIGCALIRRPDLRVRCFVATKVGYVLLLR